MIPNISIRNLSPNSAGLLPSIKSAAIPALTTVSQPQLLLAGYGDVSVSTQGSSNKGRSNLPIAGYGDVSVSTQGSSNKGRSNLPIAGYGDVSVSTQGSLNRTKSNLPIAGFGDVSVSTQGSLNRIKSNQSLAGYSDGSVSSMGSSFRGNQSLTGYGTASNVGLSFKPFKHLSKPFRRLLNKSDIPALIRFPTTQTVRSDGSVSSQGSSLISVGNQPLVEYGDMPNIGSSFKPFKHSRRPFKHSRRPFKHPRRPFRPPLNIKASEDDKSVASTGSILAGVIM
jgi:hypothetical protein